MNTTREDSGPAFPIPGMPPVGTGDPRDGMAGGCDPQPSMSLRDWFAGMALQGILANQKTIEALCEKDDDLGVEVAALAFEAADRMLAARKDKP